MKKKKQKLHFIDYLTDVTENNGLFKRKNDEAINLLTVKRSFKKFGNEESSGSVVHWMAFNKRCPRIYSH